MKSRTRTTATWLGLATLAVVASVAAVAQGEPSNDQPPDRAAITGLVGALGETPDASDRLPAVAASEVRTAGLIGADLDRSVQALAQAEHRLYLTPADDGVCLSLVDPAGGATVECQSRLELDAGPASPNAVLRDCEGGSPTKPPTCHRALLYGIAPNGFDRISTVGGAASTEVVNNVYLLDVNLDKVVESLRFEGSKGTVERPAGAFN